MEKDREATRRRIYNAMVELLTEGGFKALGVNAVARRAGVGKSLIYRYFGGMEGLLLSYAREGDFWPVLEEQALEQLMERYRGNLPEMAKAMWVEALRELRSRRNTQEIIRWELVEDNDLAQKVGEYRVRQAALMLKPFEHIPGLDAQAVTALLSAGMIYIVLLAKHRSHYFGIDLHDEAGWSRLEKAASAVYEALIPAQPAAS